MNTFKSDPLTRMKVKPDVVKKRPAYSYARFSTGTQALGDSLRRQFELSDAYAHAHDLQIDKTLTDRGISGFRSDNLAKGALGKFIHAIHLGKVKPGSILLVESLDRLSRDEVTEQLSLFLTIISAGVEIITLADERSYAKANINADPTQLIISIVLMIRGWEESERKSGRLKHAWQSKRADDSQLRLTSKCPFWLKPSLIAGKRFEEIPERVKVIRLIFKLAAEGKGARSICKIINEKGNKPWGSGKWWNSNYVRRILRGRAVLGEYQPRLRPTKNERLAAGPPKVGYYPPVIDAAVWHKANQLAAPQVRSKNNGLVTCLFTNLVYDGATNVAMRYRGANGAGQAKLFSAAVEKGAAPDYWSYALLEESVLQQLQQLDWNGVLADPAQGETAIRRQQLQGRLNETKLSLERTIQFVTQHNMKSVTLAAQIQRLEEQQADLERQLAELDSGGGERTEIAKQMREAQDEFMKLVKNGDPDSRLQLRAELRLLIKHIHLWPRPAECAEIQPYYPLLEKSVRAVGMEWKGSPTSWPCYKITFVNGEQRWVLCESHRLKKRKSVALQFERVHSLAIVCPGQQNETAEKSGA